MITTKKIAVILGVVAVIAGGVFVTMVLQGGRSGKVSRSPERLVFAVAALLDSVPVLVAHHQGFFVQQGLDVEIKFYSAGKDALAAVRRGEADFATVADFPIMLAALDGADIRVLATISKSGRENSIVARKDSGITVPAHIRGKVVGVIPGTTSEFFLDEFLVMHGIPRSDIVVVELTPGETVNALLSKRVDAVSTWGQHAADLLKGLGDNSIRFFAQETYQMYWNIVASRNFVAGHRDTVQKVVTALDQANSSIRNNADGAKKTAMEAFRVDPAQLREVWPDYEFDLALDHTLLLTLESQARWAMKQNRTTVREVPNFQEFIYADALRRIKPAAVSVMR
ncbi:NrtA/SsuA/CpmA family ABC transporter substrate-binding protein [Geobacter hydrogenophilus]|uniref:ABC transporter substrate-binding protein n=1 Tax=Geobacter hydrogenophilus TaxID=40983 RepID=UPI001BD94521|nr:NrtA/SsuA/CpmA family ABC transporter substrate-binding protein [Geobacter hydrogenophilus]MBT0894821.1 NrtA/SsuA/CpmA family ABC transporter substrate-binding protein [Geobacter hydrogenophilus]